MECLPIGKNVARDALVREQLREEGWALLVLWQCELIDLGALARRLLAFLGP